MSDYLPPEDQPEWCQLCHDAAPVEGDIFCAECRQRITDSSDQITDPLEPVLSAHFPMAPLSSDTSTMCRCGERFDSGPAVHRRHLAQMIYEALGLPGPTGWLLGPESAMREHPMAEWLTADIGRNERR